jgi:Ca-activated chloride channel family protein
MKKKIFILLIFVFWNVSIVSGAEEHPDELYQKGHFSEAEQAYAEADMEHPKDIRFRYNRGCAAYQNSDFEGAVAAFSSVLKRTGDNEIRFKAIFNMGNAAYKKGDLQAAVTSFKKALTIKPQSEDARYNLELSLRELEKQKEKKPFRSKRVRRIIA